MNSSGFFIFFHDDWQVSRLTSYSKQFNPLMPGGNKKVAHT